MTPQERKASIKLLYKEHADYFKNEKKPSLHI